MLGADRPFTWYKILTKKEETNKNKWRNGIENTGVENTADMKLNMLCNGYYFIWFDLMKCIHGILFFFFVFPKKSNGKSKWL